jgi:hypothetical protein
VITYEIILATGGASKFWCTSSQRAFLGVRGQKEDRKSTFRNAFFEGPDRIALGFDSDGQICPTQCAGMGFINSEDAFVKIAWPPISGGIQKMGYLRSDMHA